ncbi:M20 aminoacylase family protein [Hydrogenophilus islandicus]
MAEFIGTDLLQAWCATWRERFPVWQAWRRHLHRHPELAFAEEGTARFVVERLREWGLSPDTGWAKTGVVARLAGARGHGPTIALRADMDALPLDEANTFAHRSAYPGRMHACGHDGHTAMLLAAAEVLGRAPDFAGTVVFLFQPAEEGGGGARVMVEEGVLEAYAIDEIYALHNWPGLPLGTFAVHSGAVMAGTKSFDLTFRASGTHAAMPHLGSDLIVAASQFVTLAQSAVSRQVSPTDAAVFSVTQIHGGSAYNVLPDTVRLSGTVRAFSPATMAQVTDAVTAIAESVARIHHAQAEWHWHDGYPPTINHPGCAEQAAQVAAALVGEAQIARDLPPSMGAEDFAYFLEKRPGAYLWIGNGPGEGGCVLHNSRYDFNDAILPLGAAFWWQLVRSRLGAS